MLLHTTALDGPVSRIPLCGPIHSLLGFSVNTGCPNKDRAASRDKLTHVDAYSQSSRSSAVSLSKSVYNAVGENEVFQNHSTLIMERRGKFCPVFRGSVWARGRRGHVGMARDLSRD